PTKELVSVYRSAIELLKSTQDPSTGKRLISCAELLLDSFVKSEREELPSEWEGFSFRQFVHDGERAVIERALRDARGSVTSASPLLGFKHHQSLISLINSRHPELLKTRSTVRKRRHHIFWKPRKARRKPQKQDQEPVTSQVSVLHVEDHERVARMVGEMLAAKQWRVELSANGDSA